MTGKYSDKDNMSVMRLFSVDVKLIICIAAAWAVELALGAPRIFPQLSAISVRFIRATADRFLALTGRKASAEKLAGFLLALYIALFAFILIAVPLNFVYGIHPALYYLLNAYLCARMLNTRASADRALVELKTLDSGDAAGIWRAIDRLSKSFLEGVLAPLIFMSAGVFLGVPAAICAMYKALSALARNAAKDGDEYGGICWAASGIDYALAFFPARVCGLALPFFAPLCGTGARGIARGLHATRDGYSARASSNKNERDNSAWPAAALAGSLGIRPCTVAGAAAGAKAVAGAGADAWAGAAAGTRAGAGAGTKAGAAAGTRAGAGAGMGGGLLIEHGIIDGLREPELGDIRKAARMTIAASAFAAALCCGMLLYCRAIISIQ